MISLDNFGLNGVEGGIYDDQNAYIVFDFINFKNVILALES